MKECRIVEKELPSGTIVYTIQQKHWLFKWLWCDASYNMMFPYVQTTFSNLSEAKDNLCWFDGTKTKERVIE